MERDRFLEVNRENQFTDFYMIAKKPLTIFVKKSHYPKSLRF